MKEEVTITLFTSSDYKKVGEAIQIGPNIDASRQLCSQLRLVCRQLPMSLVLQKVNDRLLFLYKTSLF
jgi:hypothetical protein